MGDIPITVEGFKKLEIELDNLKKERPAVIQAIKEAREEGDLRENAGYEAARERQGMLEARINYIESRMARFNVIDLTLGGDRVTFGATVEVEDLGFGRDQAVHPAGTRRGRFRQGHHFHPLARKALLGKEEGDEIVVEARAARSATKSWPSGSTACPARSAGPGRRPGRSPPLPRRRTVSC